MTFVVPQNLHQELREQMTKDQYGLRGKSKWITEAIDLLLELDTYPDLVSFSDNMHGFTKVETISVDLAIKQKVEAGVVQIRRQFPLLEGVQSCLIRTAIIQRLLRSIA